MALKWKGRVRETSTTTGPGALTLAGAVTAYGTFASLMSTGDTCYGTVAHRTTTEWEDCLFTMESNGTLTRTTVIDGSSGVGVAVSLSSGTKDVFLGLPPAIIETLLGASLVTLGTASYVTSERVATAGTGITLTDGGAGSTLTFSVDTSAVDHGGLGGLPDDDHTQYALLAGRSGGQSLTGGTASGDDLTLSSTSHATKGTIFLGSASAFDQANNRLGLGTTSPSNTLHVVGDFRVVSSGSGGSDGIFRFYETTSLKWNLYTYGGTNRFSWSNATGVDRLNVLQTGEFAIGTGVNLYTSSYDLTVRSSNATTNGVVSTFAVAGVSTGTPTTGYGVSQLFLLESSTTIDQTAGIINCYWTDATHASRTSSVGLYASYTGTAQEGLRVIGNSDGNARTYVPYRLGIAVTAPDAPLHVDATTSTWTPCAWFSDQNSTLGAGVYFEWRAGAANNKIHAWLADSYGLSWYRMTDAGTGFVRTGPIPDLLIDTNGRVGIGVVPTLAATLHVRETATGASDAVSTILCVDRGFGSAPLAGFGQSWLFRLSSSTTVSQDAGRINCRWGVATHASREGIVSIIATDYNGDRTGFEVTGDGTNTEIGFYGVTPVARPSAYTQTYSTADKTHANPTAATLTVTDGAGTNDNTIGAITADASVIAAVQELADEINKLVADMADLKQLVNSVIDDLQSLGLLQ